MSSLTTEQEPLVLTAEPARHLDALRRRVRLFVVGLTVALVVVVLMALALGPVSVPLGEVLARLAAMCGFDVALDPRYGGFVEVRLWRVVLGLGTGAALGVAGAALQGLFRNPLADPGLIGVSSGARLGATTFIVLGGGSLIADSPLAALLLLPTAAFVGALATMATVRALASRAGVTTIATLLLAGLAITVFEGAAVGLLTTYVADDEALRTATMWRFGTLGGADAAVSLSVLGVSVAGSLVLLSLARPLDALMLGEAEAAHLGVRVERLERTLVIVAALVVATATAFVGIVGFVGLVVPHVVRLAAGPTHRVVLPGSMLAGAVLVLLSDLLARTIVAPQELRLGVVTAFVGAPFFLWLVTSRRGAH